MGEGYIISATQIHPVEIAITGIKASVNSI